MAWLAAEAEGPEPENPLLTDEQFEEEVALAAAGDWEALGLDQLPEGWAPATIDELRAAT